MQIHFKFCDECGELLEGLEQSIGLCSICASNDHLADIDWEGGGEELFPPIDSEVE